jgi:GT2 family glycosyltransferase
MHESFSLLYYIMDTAHAERRQTDIIGDMSEISVVIPNYNNAPRLERCISALLKNQGIKEIIVVDDASTDDSIEVLQKYPNIRLLQNKNNLGPVKSRNLGAAIASGKYLFFMDSDAELEPAYLETLHNFLEHNPQVAVVSGKILSGDERIWYNFGPRFAVIQAAGSKIFNDTFPYWRDTRFAPIMKELSTPFTGNFRKDIEQEVGWVIEMAFMTPRSVFLDLKGFDEGFFMFHEGPDYSERARQKLGLKTYYLPQVTALDLGGHSHAGTRSQIMRESNRYWRKKHGIRLW